MIFKVKTTKIDYCIEDEDVCWQFDNDPTIEEDSEEYYEAIHAEIKRLKETLPQEIVLEIECEEEDLSFEVCDAVSEQTGWLTNSVEFEILESRPDE